LSLSFAFALALALAFTFAFGAWCGCGEEASVKGLLVEVLPHLAIVGKDGNSFLFGESGALFNITGNEEDVWVVPMLPDLINLIVIK
jgi:hypothetical protein